MSAINYPPVIDLSQELTQGFAARFIRYKASRLVGHAGIRPCDQEDLEQDLRLHLVRRFPKFNPKVGHWNAFVVTVVSRHILTLLVQRCRGKRRHELAMISLEEIAGAVPESGDDDTVAKPRSEQCMAVEDTSQRDLAIDVRETVARLPPASRELCRQLMQESPAEVARSLGVPRTTLCGRILSLRKEFTARD